MRKIALLLFLALAMVAAHAQRPACGSGNINASYNDNVNYIQYLCTTAGWKANTGIGAPTVGYGPACYGNQYVDVQADQAYVCGVSGWVSSGGAGGPFLPLAGGRNMTGATGGPPPAGGINATALEINGAGVSTVGFANPMTTLGDVIYGGVSGTAASLAGPTAAATYILTEVATGSSVAPVWSNFATLMASPGPIGTTTRNVINGTQISATANILGASTFEATGPTANITYQGGQDNGASSSAAGSGVFRGANNNGTGAAGVGYLEAGANSGGGQQGWAAVLEYFTTAAALSNANEVVCGGATDDRIAACGLGTVAGVVGIANATGGTGTPVGVFPYGKATVRFDGTPVDGDTACAPPPSTGTAGLAHDNGNVPCTTSSLIGVVTGQVSGTGSGATATVLLKLN